MEKQVNGSGFNWSKRMLQLIDQKHEKQLNFDLDSVAFLTFQSFPLRGSKKQLNMGVFNCFP